MASTTATALFKCMPSSAVAPSTALMTSESFPTPEGSMRMRSGLYFKSTSFNAVAKSPTSEQQMQPEFISVISIPASFKKPPSIPISPNSFSMSTTCSPASASFKSFLISVVFPAPKNPETISILVIFIFLSNGQKNHHLSFCHFISFFASRDMPRIAKNTKKSVCVFPAI